ncbi:MAG TPA: hypothetical protein ENI97_08450 [Gammaproteobacteria bacterium]|nr:hypothetical protein [Gammaproteobacteria bacterium]
MKTYRRRVNREHALMNKQTLHRLIFGVLLILPLMANAAFITDRIVVEVRSERFGQGSVLKKIPSGTSVEVLMSDGQYTRIRTPDNVTGWVASTFLTKKKPTQLEYLELLNKNKTLEAKLREAEARLASDDGNTSDSSISAEQIARLKEEAKNARWMKVEMQKARDRAQQAEAKLKALKDQQAEKGQQDKNIQQQLEDLRVQKDELEKRLAAALLVNEQQAQQQADTQQPPIPTINPNPHAEESPWQVGLEWLLVLSVLALFAGIIIGITWLDRRIRQRHGGFRIY